MDMPHLSIGHIVIKNLLDHNYKGPIYPINPKSKFIKSFRAYPSVMDVPDEIDLVNISIKNTLVPLVLEECGKKGVKFAIWTMTFSRRPHSSLGCSPPAPEAYDYGALILHV